MKENRIGMMSFIEKVFTRKQNRNEQFFATFAITYLITIVFTVLVAFNYFEDMMVKEAYTAGPLKFMMSGNRWFSFGYCQELDAWTYLFAKIIETLIPTTLTFSGTILMLQASTEKNTTLRTELFIFLFMFGMLGVFFMVCRLQSMLKLYILGLLVLFCIIYGFSEKLFVTHSSKSDGHKSEESDGKFVS